MADQKLFNQTLQTSIADTDRIAFAKAGDPISGAKNIVWSAFKNLIKAITYSFIDFVTVSNPSYLKGRVFYDNVKNALSYYNDNSEMTVNLGQEIVFPVSNNSGALIPNGSIVTPDSSGVVLADRHLKDKSRLIAIATTDIPTGGTGYVTRLGQVGGLDTSSFTLGQTLYLGSNGQFATDKPTDGSYEIIVGIVDVVDANDGVITVDINVTNLTVEVTDTNGFPLDQKENSTLSFVNGTRTFSISSIVGDVHYYVLGDKFEFSGSKSIVIPDLEGQHWFYFDNLGILNTKYNPNQTEAIDIVRDQCFIAQIYWNATSGIHEFDIFEERHGISMSPSTHVYLHITRGAQFGSGYGLGDFIAGGNGSLDAHAQFSAASGTYYDEDIQHIFAGKSVGDTIAVGFLSGANSDFRSVRITGFSVWPAPAGTLYFNVFTGGAWAVQEVGNNNFVLYHIFAVNGVNEQIISVMGQNEYSTLSAARDGASTEISNIIGGFDINEAVPVGTIIYKCNTSYTNTVKAAIQEVASGVNYVDWRTTELAQGAAPSSHNNLTNVEQAGVGVTQGHVDEALFNTINRIIYESSGWWSTLNTVTENVLELDLNRTQVFIQKAGTIKQIKLYIEDLGTNPNGIEVNFVVGLNDLILTDQALSAGWNTFTTLQNTSVSENDEIQLAVRIGSGNDDIGDFSLFITVE